MDSFDEFEFKPITEGLGFHKKSPLKSEEKEEVDLPTFRSQEVFTEKTTEKPVLRDAPKVRQPLPRAGDPTHVKPEAKVQTKAAAPTPTLRQPTPEVLPAATLESKLVPIAVNVPAILIDAIVVMALSILFLVALLVVTKLDLGVVAANLQSDAMTQMSLCFLVLSVLQLYMIALRGFFGSTIGEWAFDSQLGTAEQQAAIVFPLQVLWRTVFMTLTGLVLVPIVSAVMGRDVAAYASGLSLLKRKE